MTGPRIFVVDNYDSFTYNLVQELGELGAVVEVARNDAFSIADVAADPPDGVVISPGPGAPKDAGLSNEVVRVLAGRVPILGVCLGHQCIAEVYGGVIVRAPELVHGKPSPITHDGRGVFAGLPQPFPATRYHSLVLDPATVPAELEVTARTPDGLIMGLRHRLLPVEGVQFHPESILTVVGMDLLGNFLRALRAGSSA
ncbi:MAG: aminodeoxychorismate/anthranilate synthase component II [Euzebyaceae bacterium]|nr:aminodeoxychorismate/anthranilate synthase component II [Euzebyaceae bacterium]